MRFPARTFAELTDYLTELPVSDQEAATAARARDAVLTKPPGALGRLEEIAIWYAGWRGEAAPHIVAPQVIVFAGNHGICDERVSAFPAEVTHQMVGNFEAGGAAINQLSALAGAQMKVVPLDLDTPTRNFSQAPAMTEEECLAAFTAGWDAVDAKSDLLVVGEMGIGNTTAAAALATALLGGSGADWAGRGTGLDDAGVAHKAAVIDAAVARHEVASPLAALATFGGREIAAMAGAMVRTRAERIPVILDGFICSSAALVLHRIDARALDHCIAGHLSAEGAHRRMLDSMDKSPLLDLGLRLGEGSGAALAIQIVKGAIACHSGMATFAEAGVSDG